jgi:hypothetical protein
MEEGMEIPIGGDLTGLQEAFAAVIAAVEKMGNQIVAALEKSQEAMTGSDAAMRQVEAGANAAGAAVGNNAAKFTRLVSVAGNLGDAMSGAHAGLKILSGASRVLTGINLAASLSAWIQRAGGVRAAFSQIPAAMSAIASNPVFRRVAIGAAAAVAGIVAIRVAWRTAAASAGILRSTAQSVFNGIVRSARAAASAIAATFRGISTGVAAIMPGGFAIGGLLSAASAIGIAVKSIDKAAEMETLETAFAPLLGGAQAAKERIAELAKFAATTPFELPEVAQASRILETLTKGALATGEGLRFAGDIASGTQQPIEELSVWIGRLYDGLQSGRPVGEAMMRLQELGALSGVARTRIEELQESGAKGPAVWNEAAAALGRFSGSMERQSLTWKGKLSNLSDSIGMLLAKFGTPIIDALKPYLDAVTKKVESMQGTFAKLGDSIRSVLDGTMAAFQTGSVIPLLMNGLELAFLNGINVFMRGIQSGLKILSLGLGGILGSIGEGLQKSGIANVFGHLADAMASTIAMALMKTIGKLTGRAGWYIDADQEKANSQASMAFAKQGMAKLDFLGGFEAAAKKLEETVVKVKAEWSDPKRKNFVDTSDAEQSVNEIARMLQIKVRENQAAAAATRAALDAKLVKPDDSTGEAVNKGVTPAVMSLTRIGGGGFAQTVMQSHLAEARKHTGLLKTLVSNTSKTSGTPAGTFA